MENISRQDIKARITQHADAIDTLASSLRTMGHDAAISIIEYRHDRAVEYLDVAEKLVLDLQQQIKIARTLVLSYGDQVKNL